jgi:hypothetical protein
VTTHQRLKTFLTGQMRQSHIFQSVLKKGGSSKTKDIALAILSHDPRQAEYYSQVAKNMVGRVFTDVEQGRLWGPKVATRPVAQIAPMAKKR